MKELSEFFTLLFATENVVNILFFSDNADGTLSDYWIRESKNWMLKFSRPLSHKDYMQFLLWF